MSDELTVEKCLRILREMFPEFHMRTITVYDPDPGEPYTTISLHVDDDHDPQRSFSGKNLTGCMARVRAFKQSQEQER